MRRLLFIMVLSISTICLYAQKTYLHCGQLIDVKQLQVLKQKTVVIEGNKIVDILDGYAKAGANDKTIDLKSIGGSEDTKENKHVKMRIPKCHKL